MSLVFVNYPLETFTPTASGAIATIIWECCRAALMDGASPTVITRSSTTPIFPWPNTLVLEYPSVPTNLVLVKALRAQRRLTGWNHLRHKAYAIRVAQAAATATDNDAPLVLINDPEMVIYLRRRFPSRRIVHWFENQQEARPRIKRDYAKCTLVATCGVSDFTSRWVRDYYGVATVSTLYNGVDSQQFIPAEEPVGGVPFINFVGRTGIEKAPDLLLKAALQLSDSITRDFGVQLVGSNHWDRFEMDDYQRELGGYVDLLTQRGIDVRRPGHVGRSELPNQFRKCHIHVVPSRWDEPFGLTTVEGMATGLATIGSNTGGTPEVIGDSGMLFERDSVDGLTTCLARCLANEEDRLESGRRARERALQFNWRRTWTELKGHAGV
jgi:glycosyltransferase involved in cell wall biosynthesis